MPPELIVEERRASMRDGVGLRTVVCRPADDRPHPALLTRTPYDIGVLLLGSEHTEYARAGYAVVLQDARGTGGSDGTWEPLVCESADGADTVDWVAHKEWCDGRVGMYGLSYGSSTQWLALAGGAALHAIAPTTSTADFFHARFDPGGPLRLAFNVIWTAQVAAQALRRTGTSESALDDLVPLMDFARVTRENRWGQVFAEVPELVRPLVEHRPLRELDSFARIAPWFYGWMFDEDPHRPFWSALSPASYHHKIDTPALHVAGWFDTNLEGTIANYTGMRANAASPRARERQRLVIGPWRHWAPGETRLGDVDFGPLAARSMTALNRSWFDEQFHDASPSGPPVEIFVMGRNVWRAETEWPLARAVDQPHYLSSPGDADDGRGTLRPEPPIADGVDEFFYDPADPVPSVGGRLFILGEFAGPYDQQAVESRPDVLVYTSPPLDADLEVTGRVRAEVWLASSAPDTDLTAKLVDVHPDGRALNVCDGILRARTVHPTPLAAGTAYRYRIDLGSTSQVFLTGHRLRLQVSSSSYPQFEVNPNTGQPTGSFTDSDLVVAHQRVLHGPTWPSRLILPVVPPSQ